MGDGKKVHCKKQLTGTGDSVRRLIKHWLLLGHSVDDGQDDARTKHRDLNLRRLECPCETELDSMLSLLFPDGRA